MTSIKRQIGGLYSTMFLLAAIGGAALLMLTVLPIYMDEAKAAKIVSQVAVSSQNANLPITEIRRTLQRRWDVDDVKNLKVKDVKLVKDKSGKALAYNYEVRTHLFANWDLVLTFDKRFQMAAGGG